MTHDKSKKDDNLDTRTVDGRLKDHHPIPAIDRIGTFKIEKTISAGGAGTIYLAFDESMKRQVAIKVLHPALGIIPSAQIRFARESWIAGRLDHPNIIKVFSRGEEKQLNYIAMEYAEGGSLSDYIKELRNSVSPTKDITAIANQEHINFIVTKFIDLARAIEHIHSKDFIHRDIKPHNILLSGESKQFKLTDFGIAHAEDMTKITKAGDFMGTIQYMSPEQITAHRTTIDKRTDIYSFGVSLYEAVTLSLPFDGDTEEKLIGEIIAGHYVPARKRHKLIPKDLETVLMKATHHDPQRRYQSGKELAKDLILFLEDRPITGRRDSVFYKTRKNLSLKRSALRYALMALALVVLTGIIVVKAFKEHHDRDKILRTLKHAVATKTSPFEFEPEWEILSKKLYEHVNKGKSDSMTIWFLKTVAIPKFYYPKYVPAKDAKVWVVVGRINVFDDETYAKEFTLAHAYSELYIENTNNLNVPLQGFRSFKNGIPGPQKMDISPFSTNIDSAAGRRSAVVKSVHSYFLNTRMYESVGSYIKRRNKNVELIEAEIVVLPNGDSLIPFNGRKSGASVNELIPIDLNNSTKKNPVWEYVTYDTLEIWAFEEWPEDLPKSVTDSSLKSGVRQAVEIVDLKITKQIDRNGKSLFYTKLTAGQDWENGSETPVPVVGDFEIRNKASSETILTGTLKRGGTHFNFFFIYETHITSFVHEEGTVRWFSSDNIGLDSVEFENLTSLGQIDALMIITPSRHWARVSGDVTEFWGETLTFEITFQAIDSTKIN